MSSAMTSGSVHEEKRVGYAILRMVLIMDTWCFVSKEARLYLMILHILVTVLRLSLCCSLFCPVESCITPRYLNSPLGIMWTSSGFHALVVYSVRVSWGGALADVCSTVRNLDCTISSPNIMVNADTIIAFSCRPRSEDERVMRSSQYATSGARLSSPLRERVYSGPACDASREQRRISKKAIHSTELGTSPCPVPLCAVKVLGLSVSWSTASILMNAFCFVCCHLLLARGVAIIVWPF